MADSTEKNNVEQTGLDDEESVEKQDDSSLVRQSPSTGKPEKDSDETAKKQNRRYLVSQQVSQFTGPVPPPDIWREYDEILPGAADRMLTMVEKEQEHRLTMEAKMVDAQVKESETDLKKSYEERKLGQIFGFFIGVIAIACGSWVSIAGAEIAGSVIGTGGIAGLASVFVARQRQSKKEREEVED